jgi:hypothetical protein
MKKNSLLRRSGLAMQFFAWFGMVLNPLPLSYRAYAEWRDDDQDGVKEHYPQPDDDGDDDGDYLSNDLESYYGTSRYNPDTDYDGIPDTVEIDITHTDPLSPDTDGDGFSDYDEWINFYGVYYAPGAFFHSWLDYDGDGVRNHEDPYPMDFGDLNNNGVPDDQESGPVDSDGDGHFDEQDSHPSDAALWNDWNGNGINDSDETQEVIDTDFDGLPDYLESMYGTVVGVWDSDGDGLSDGEEIYQYNTTPTNLDTDGDFLTDYEEVRLFQTEVDPENWASG